MVRGKLILKLRYLLTQPLDAIGVQIRWLVSHGLVHQRAPLLTRLMQIDGRLAVKCETQQKQSGYCRNGRKGEAHFNSPLLIIALP